MFDSYYTRSYANRKALTGIACCGCYHCVTIFDPREIQEYEHDLGGDTAICPYCGIDSVVPYDFLLDGPLGEFEIKLQDAKGVFFG